MEKTVRILGTHGVPAAYGGFETAAENIGLFLASRGWRVIVYCQTEGRGPVQEDRWRGLERVLIPVDIAGWRGTSKFDWLSVRHATCHRDLCITFGYNTAIFNILQRAKKIPNVINMDGIEWSRSRWGLFRQAILYVNERIACLVGDRLIADHPEIETYLLTRAPRRKLSMITYGADAVVDAPAEVPRSYGLEPGRYLTLICRPIPENSIAELVAGFSRRPRGYKLAVLGEYLPEEDPYHAQVLSVASEEVVFLGPVYDKAAVEALRFHGAAYLHGHTVGGTNPSLVEAMAAGNPVLAHDNAYNRWVAQDAAVYFSTGEDVSDRLEEMLTSQSLLEKMRRASLRRHSAEFTWEHVAGEYERLLLELHPGWASGDAEDHADRVLAESTG
jgi:glycosyltransferase involved in cell wall biosynthesis